MGLFTKRRTAAAAAPAWRSLDAEVTAAPARDMDDDGCAGGWAYEVWFHHPCGSGITVAFYASYGATEGTFGLGYRYQYWHRSGWTYTGWGSADENFTGCESFEESHKYAFGAAQTLACGDPTGLLRAALAEVFAWDGEPW